ncbi:MAG: acetate--CoA ligase family protein [Betaproteobacteria bacterium]|nr:acetate--CoA ligase family protein [Betaproteobacteria bacterium]MDH5221394.1 acetate--CoA ligase family protein [Betaproteobacteria bacterium]
MSGELFRALFAPRGVALFGASGDPAKNTARPQRYLRKHGYTGTIAPINRGRREVLGLPAFRSLAEVPGDIDHAFVMVPPQDVLATCEECFARRVPVVTIFTDGFGETDDAGRVAQARLVERARGAGVRLLGPNSIGLISTEPPTALSVNAVLELERLPTGPLGLVSQSGSLIGAFLSRGAARGIGFSRLVSVGNESDLSVGELAELLVDDPQTHAILLFLETVRDPERLARAARRAFIAGKPVIAYKLGRSAAGVELARTHTGALAGDDRAVDAFLRAAGILRVRTFEALVETAYLAIGQRPPARRRVAMMTTTGGGAALVADPLGAAGIELVAPPPALAEKIRAHGVRVTDSPLIDLTLAGARGSVYGPVLEALLASDHCDAVVAAVGSSGQFHPQIAIEPILLAHRAHPHKPLAVFIAPEAQASLAMLAEAGVAAFRAPECCADALEAFFRWRAPATAPLENPEANQQIRAALASDGPLRAEALFAALGVPMGSAQWLRDPVQPISCAFPVAIKIASPDIAHKSDFGGVELNLPDAAAAAAAARRVLERVRAARPEARIEGVVAATMQRGLGEAIVGFRRDPQVGPLVLVGAGGTLAELYGDVALRPAPVSLEEARHMVGEVRGFAALAGYRNAPRGDLEALAHAVAAFSQLAALPEVAEAEINPLIVMAQGVVGVDALLVLREGARHDDAAA